VHAEPLELAAELVRAQPPDTAYVVYERDDEWAVAIGAAVELTVDRYGVHRRGPSDAQSWGSGDFAASIESALASVPLIGWRAYGTASFELAHALQGPRSLQGDAPLLELIIPRVEVRLRRGSATVRALCETALATTCERLIRADATSSCEPTASGLRPRVPALLDEPSAEAYRQLVRQAVADIAQGKLHKVIASRVVPVPGDVDLIETYVAGRRHNSPARSFIVNRGEVMLAGFSPETVLEVSAEGRVSTQPLAGTRALVADEEENTRLKLELLSDTKELAEHAMSVKLAFDELSQVCEPNSVGVSEFMSVSRRGTVQHLASRLSGELRTGSTAWAAFQVLFPAVTASGIPKREAVDWIRRHEAVPRGLYAGAVLMTADDGSMDAALILRSVFRQGSRVWLRAGAGIVAQSTPERELEETCEKLQSIARHLVVATSAHRKFAT
jgi:salicylate synthase